MTLGRIIEVKGKGYKWVELTEDEISQALEKTRDFNFKVFDRCLADALKFSNGTSTPDVVLSIASALFGQLAIPLSAMLKTSLDKKVRVVKNGGHL